MSRRSIAKHASSWSDRAAFICNRLYLLSQKALLPYIKFQFLQLESESQFSLWILPGECRDASTTGRLRLLSCRRSISPQHFHRSWKLGNIRFCTNPLCSATLCCPYEHMYTVLDPSMCLRTAGDLGRAWAWHYEPGLSASPRVLKRNATEKREPQRTAALSRQGFWLLSCSRLLLITRKAMLW